MSSSILSQLNSRQQEAAVYSGGPLLILAGAGSGKTRVLTYRIAHLITERQISPENILALTFTNKAANEMKERIRKLAKDGPFAGTFHSFCSKILRKDGYLNGIPVNFLVFDESDQIEVIKQAMENLNISSKNFNPHAVLSTISQAKNELLSELEYPQYTQGNFQETVAKIYLEYQRLLRSAHVLDFDDLLNETVKLLEKNPETLQAYQNRYQHILVDEWQDTNKAQYQLTKLLAKQHRNLVVVGDCSQSIYGWRGANFKNVMNLPKDFPEIKTINLDQNYRSTQKILDAAYHLIKQNKSHPILELWTANGEGEPLTCYQAQSESDEALFVIQKINKIKEEENLPLSHFAVLYRTNAQSRALEEAFLHRGIPYTLVGGIKFYDRKEVKDVLAYLRLTVNPQDLVSAKRIEKLGKGRWQKFQEFAQGFSLANLTTLEILDQTLDASGYLEMYDPDNEEDWERLENIKELRSVAAEFPEIADFLTNVALVQHEILPDRTNPYTKVKDAVNLMTIHSAKGLEFPVVFLVGLEEGIFPHSRSLMEVSEIEEERRLCYVGLTRAMEKLFLTYATRRLYFGQYSSNLVSRFISEIPEDLIAFQGTTFDFGKIEE